MKKVFNVAESVVEDIQLKDIDYVASKEVLTQLLDMHKLDEDGSIMDSPVFKAYSQEVARKRMTFERTKNKVYQDVVPSDVQAIGLEWSLDYYTCELTVECQE